MNEQPQITAQSWIHVALLGFVWGATFLITEIALTGITPFWLAAYRIIFGAVLSVMIWQARGGALFTRPPRGADWAALGAIGAMSSVLPFIALAWGQQYVSAGFAGVSMASVALMVLPLAHFLVPGERITWRRALGFAIGFAGVVILIGGQAFDSSGADLELAGRLACLGAAGCYAVSSILMRRLPAIDPIGLSAMLLCIGTVMILPLAWLAEGPPPLPDQNTLITVAILGLIPTAAANMLRVLVVRTAGPVFLSLLNYQVPVWSVLLGIWFLDEAVPASLIWSMVLILIGVALSQYGALRRLFGAVQ